MEEIGRDLLRYGRLVISKELFDSDGTPIRVRIFYHSDQYWYTEMKNGKFIDVYGLKTKKGLEEMKKIVSMVLTLMMIVIMVGCGSKETTEVAPPPETDTTAIMVQKCDELLEETYGERVLTGIADGRYQVVIIEPGLTTETIYLIGLDEGYNDLSVACKEAVGMDAVVGICDATGTLIYVSLNGVDVTGSIQ